MFSALGAPVLRCYSLNGYAKAIAVVYQRPIRGFSGTVAQALRTWPQYQQINWRFFPFGNSHYNALAGRV